MKTKISILLAVSLLIASLIACTPPAPTPAPTIPPTQTATPEPSATPTRAPLNVDGRWDGGTVADGLLSGEVIFQIENNEFTLMEFLYTMRTNGCTIMTSASGTADETHINGNEFRASMYGDNGFELTLTGVFDSANSASGALLFKGTNSCGIYNRTIKWTGEKGPIPPTPSPTAPKPTATVRPSSTPFAFSTVPPRATSMPAATVRPELQSLFNAFQKTESATAFNFSEHESGSPLLYSLPNDPSNAPIPIVSFQGTVNGKDMRIKINGNGMTFLGIDPTKGFEFAVVKGKGYVHGPATFFNAPEDRWYTAPADEFNLFGIQAMSWFLGPANDPSSITGFEKSAAPITLDGLQCNTFTGGKDSAYNLISTIRYSTKSLIGDQGSAQIVVCADGYVHSLDATWTGHDFAGRTLTTTTQARWSDFNGNVIVTAPTDPNMPAITPVISINNFATPTPRPPSVTPTPGLTSILQHISGKEMLANPNSLTVDSAGKIYIGDSYNGMIQVYSATGQFLNQWNITNSNNSYLNGLAITRQGVLYANYDHKILRIDPITGQVVSTLSYSEGNRFEQLVAAPDGSLLAMWYENNNGVTQPIAGHREDIVRFDASGKFSQVYRGIISAQTGIAENNARIAVDSAGNLYAVSSSDTAPAILKFSADGKFIARLNDPTANASRDQRLFAVTVDRSDNVYVERLDGIRVFDKTGLYRLTLPLPSYFYAMAFNNQNELYGMAPSEIIKLGINLR